MENINVKLNKPNSDEKQKHMILVSSLALFLFLLLFGIELKLF